MGALNWIIKGITEGEDITLLSLFFLKSICLENETLPPSELRKLDEDLAEYLVDNALSHQYDLDEKMLTEFLDSICSVNQYFGSDDQNNLLKVLIRKREASSLGNGIIMQFNREKGGQFLYLKFFKDVFRYPPTVDFFFFNDLKVLIDIVLRNIIDLPEYDKIRLCYLEILYFILKNNQEYKTMPYKKRKLFKSFHHSWNSTNQVILPSIWQR